MVTRFTKLGDAGQWQHGGFRFESTWFIDSNAITQNIGAPFSLLFFGNTILINIGFQSLAFYGLYRLLESFDPELRKRLAILLLFPSFNVWTSVAGKEAVLVFAMGILGAYIVEMYDNREKLRVHHLLAGYLIFVFKAHYLPALLFIVGVTKVARHVRQKAAIAVLAGLISLVPLYLFADTIDRIAFDVLPHFVGFGHSTRAAFWVEPYDVFLKAPYGMFQGFYGPTFSEALSARHALQFISFVESGLIVSVLIFLLVKRLPMLPIYNAIVATFASFWILFANYPVGIMNPGSAIRYRSGYIIFLFLVFALLMSREVYISWSSRRLQPVGRSAQATRAVSQDSPR